MKKSNAGHALHERYILPKSDLGSRACARKKILPMNRKIGINKAGISTIDEKPHLGSLLLRKYRNRITTGFDDLEKFELIDRLEKPMLDFIFCGNRRVILELPDLLDRSPYSFVI